MLRRLSGQRTGEVEVVGLFIVGKGKVLDSAACYAGQRGPVTRLACTQHQQRRETTNSNEFGTETQSQHNFPNF